MEREKVLVSAEETARQKEYMDKVRALHERRTTKPLAYVHTYGCQQNVADGERLMGMLREMGCEFTDDTKRADIVLMNTCAIRENAEKTVYGMLGQLTHTKAANPDQIICLCGCMAQQPRVAEKVKTSYRHVDLVLGPQAEWRFPELLYRAYTERGRVFSIDDEPGRIAEDIPVYRVGGVSAWVSIMYGCNNFCTYCIVPYVRGGERSRKPEDILSEVRALVESGCREITLLGQNVNSYGKGSDFNCDFAELLRRISEIPGDFLLRFMTSHPKDASFRLIDIMAESPKIAHQFHLPVQSGSDRILKAMNRNYTREAYLSLIRYMRERMPDITITSDIIVGFPGETEEDFEDTLSILREVKYDMVYSFIYSKRRGTPAAQMENQVPDEVKSGRMTRLLARQNEISLEKNLPLVGRTLRVLVEGRSKTNPERFTGRTQGNKIVLFDGDDGMTGRFADIRITRAAPFTLWGEVESTDRSYKK